MKEPIIKEFDNLPSVTIDADKPYLFDKTRREKDNIERFIDKTTSSFLSDTDTNKQFVGFIYNPSPSVLHDLNKYKVLNIFITCFKTKHELNNQIILTEIDYKKYKYKQFNNENCIYITNLYNNIQVQSFSNFNFILSECSPDIIYIFITEVKPDIETYVGNLSDDVIITYEATNITSIDNVITKDKLDYDFFNELVYFKNTNANLINAIKHASVDKGRIIKLSCNERKDLNDTNLLKQIECVYKNNFDFKNRFINRREIKNVFDHNFCAYIISNYNRISNDGSLRDVNNFPALYEPISFLIHRILLPEFVKCYNIPEDDYVINATNIRIMRYVDTDNNNIMKKVDNTNGIMSIDIMLSPKNDCLGFTRKFVDDTYISFSTGDAVIYNPRLLNETKFINDKIYILSFEVELISLLHIKAMLY